MSNVPQLDAALHRTNRVRRWADLLAAGASGIALLLAAILAAVLLDAVLALSAAGLVIVDAVLILLALAVSASIARRWWHNRFDARRVARFVEQRLGYRDSRLINAVQFAGAPALAMSPALCAQAVREAEASSPQVVPIRVIDARLLRRSSAAAFAAVAIFTLAVFAAPRLFTMVVPRYLNPAADLPPFTLVRFSISTEPQRIYYGKPATIRASLAGPFIPQTADVVFVDGERRDRMAMHRQEAGAFLLPLHRVDSSRRFYIDTPHGRSHTQELTVLPIPLFESVTVRYDYPAYTGWPSTQRTLDGSGIHALIGTHATITVQSNLPLRHGQVKFVPDSPGVPPSVQMLMPVEEDLQIARGTLALTANGRYELALIASDGTPSDGGPWGPIVVTTDRPPSVQLMAPDLRSVAPEGWKVPVKVAASDDIGIGRIVLHHRVNDQAAVPIELDITHHRSTYASASFELDVSAIGAKAGDTIRGFATAFDNHPSPSQAADSPTFEVRIVTEDEYRELAREQYALEELLAEIEAFNAERQRLGEMREKLIERLAAMKESGADEQQVAEARKQLEEYAQHSQALADRMSARAEQMALYSFEPTVQKQLKEAAEKLVAQSQRAGRAGAGLSSASHSLDQAIEQLKADRDEEAEDEADRQLTEQQLRQLQLADRIMAEADAIMAITELQRDLAERLTPYKNSTTISGRDDQSRLRGLGEEQEMLRQELEAALVRMKQAAADAAEDLPRMSGSAGDLISKIRDELAVEEDQDRAAASALASRGGAAHHAADEAARKLESLIRECSGLGNCAGDDLDGILNLTRSQIAAAMSELAGARRGRGMGSGMQTGSGYRGGTGLGAAGMQAGGTASRATLLGPHSRTPMGKPTARINQRTGTYNTQDGGFGQAEDAPAAERLEAEGGDPSRRAAAGPPGVPLQYRRLAEQYFRRLAEDTR